MLQDGYAFDVDFVTKFHGTILVRGWFHHPTDRLSGVSLSCGGLVGQTALVGQPHGGVLALGPDKGFLVQALRSTSSFDPASEICFETESGKEIRASLLALSHEAILRGASLGLVKRFQAELAGGGKLLDIGGRDRSGLDRSKDYPQCDVTVLDIVESQNVDVVGDAHQLSKHFPREHFDAVMSVSVFEHLLMPWKVAIEINKVLKTGGIGMVFTHQTLGMHDLPWDFWRFSDNAWKALFNAHTGFEILATALDRPHFVVPFYFTIDKDLAENAAGFEGSAVLFRKTGPCQEQWLTEIADIEATEYPH